MDINLIKITAMLAKLQMLLLFLSVKFSSVAGMK